MTHYRFLNSAALAVLALAATAVPAHAQDNRGRGARGERVERTERPSGDARPDRSWGRSEARAEARSGGGERPAVNARQSAEASAPRPDWGGGMRGRSEARVEARGDDSAASRDWAAQRQARDDAAREQGQRSGGAWARPGDRRDGVAGGNQGTASWQRDGSYGARSRDWQRDRREDARRDERRDDARNYANGYRDGRRDDNRRDGQWDNRRYDNRYAQDHRRWDNRGWRNDNRYDWYRYRAANRSLFSLGRYYAPYRGYSYSRINIGFRLGSPFYANRYWINDPWQYRLPAVYGPYRWIRYYDDALLVDIYSGEVVDAINNFFW